jgi:hypothetical protein
MSYICIKLNLSRIYLMLQLKISHGLAYIVVAPKILIVLFLIYLFDNIIQLISLRSLWYYGGW